MGFVILAIVTGVLALVAHGEHHPLPAIILTVVAVISALIWLVMLLIEVDDGPGADTVPDSLSTRQVDYPPVLRLPAEDDIDHAIRLRRKRDEYLRRIQNARNPDTSAGTRYKYRLLNHLITIGPVNTAELEETLREEEGIYFEEAWYDEACRVIQDYIETGGTSLRGGGLPT